MTRNAAVLAAYDGSPAAQAALRAVGALLAGARVTVLTVHRARFSLDRLVHPGGDAAHERARQGAEEIERGALDEARATAEEGVRLAGEAGLRADPVVVEARGRISSAITAAARDHGADLIACGTRGRGGFARSLLGSTASSVLHDAERPVLVVPDGGGELSGPAVVAYDGSEEARAAIAAAGRLMAGRPAVIVHAWESTIRHTLSGRALGAAPVSDVREITDDLERMFAEGAQRMVDEGVALAREAGLDATGEPYESGSGAWRALAAAARARGAAVIVVGSHGHGRAGSVLLGSVSSGLVHNAEAPTLVVPAEGDAGN
jgi:nucleotide-binding universal stress UspA family protein